MIDKKVVFKPFGYTGLKCCSMFPVFKEDEDQEAPEFGAYIETNLELFYSLGAIITSPICLIVQTVATSILTPLFFLAMLTQLGDTNELNETAEMFCALCALTLASLIAVPLSPLIEAANVICGLIADNPTPTAI